MASVQPEPTARQRAPRFDAGRHHRGQLGFVLLPNEDTIEDDLFMMAPQGVGLHFARAPMPLEVNVANLASMQAHLAEASARLLPGRRLDVVCYACTSGSVVMGEETVVAELRRPFPERRATTLLTGVIEGLRAVGARRVVIGTPYLDEINTLEADYLDDRGFDVLAIEGLGLTLDAEMNALTPAFLAEFAQGIDRPDADAVFVSCGALRTIEILDRVEAAIAKPVVASNQAMLWHCLRLAGIDDRIPGFGRLLAAH